MNWSLFTHTTSIKMYTYQYSALIRHMCMAHVTWWCITLCNAMCRSYRSLWPRFGTWVEYPVLLDHQHILKNLTARAGIQTWSLSVFEWVVQLLHIPFSIHCCVHQLKAQFLPSPVSPCDGPCSEPLTKIYQHLWSLLQYTVSSGGSSTKILMVFDNSKDSICASNF